MVITHISKFFIVFGILLSCSFWLSSASTAEMESPIVHSHSQHHLPQHTLTSDSDTRHHLRHARHKRLTEARHQHRNSLEDNSIVKERAPILEPSTECKGCAKNQLENKMDHNTFLHLMLEKEKLKILKKLRLTEPPAITEQLENEELPGPLVNGDMVIPHSEHEPDMDLEDFYAKTEQVIVFSESLTPNLNCPKRQNIASACLNFQLPKEVVGEKVFIKVSSAELWVYKQPNASDDHNQNLSFRVAEIFKSDTHNGNKAVNVESRHNVGNNEGWETLNLTSTVENWINKTLNYQRRNMTTPPLMLQLGCRNCSRLTGQSPIDVTLIANRPFLVINIAGTVQRKRKRRNIDCQPGLSECCRESFKVNFRDIGWGWITQPTEYDAYYCKGSCSGVNGVSHSVDSHPTVVQKYLQYNSHDNRTAELTPCCTAQKLSSISLVYRMDNKTLIHKAVSNMVVESCGCN